MVMAMAKSADTTRNGAIAGAAAALVWAATEPLDKPIFRCSYSDVEFLGKAVTRGPKWRVIGLVMHLANGALFGAIYANVRDRLAGPGVARGITAGMVEHLLSWPGVAVADKLHPARDQLVTMRGNSNAFRQATWRHLLFGAALGIFEERLNAPQAEQPMQAPTEPAAPASGAQPSAA